MSDEQVPSGSPEDDSENQTQEVSNTVKYDTYRKVLSEAKKAKSELEELRKWREEQERKALEEDGRKDDLLEHWKQKAAELDAKVKESESLLAQNRQREVDARKFGAFADALPGKLDRKYWGLVDLDSIVVDEDGSPLPDSVEKAVKAFNETYPEVLSKKNPHNVNSPYPEGNQGKSGLTKAEWMKLPASQRQARLKDVTDFSNSWLANPPDSYSVNGRRHEVTG